MVYSHIANFKSSSPYSELAEHRYMYCEGNPVMMYDSNGLYGTWIDVFYGPDRCGLWFIRQWSQKVLDWVDEWQPNPNLPYGNGHDPRNAFRHCIWQCILSMYCGNTMASLSGYLHEFGVSPRDPDRRADETNNRRGRQYERCANGVTDCWTKCECGLSNGDLVTYNENGIDNPRQPYFTRQGGPLSDPGLAPRIQ